MTRQRGASRGVNLKKYNQNKQMTLSEARSGTIPPSAAHLATSAVGSGREEGQCSQGQFAHAEGSGELATLRVRTARALAELQRGFAAVRLQRAWRRRFAMVTYAGIRAWSRAQVERRRNEQEQQENLGLKKQQLFEAVEGLQDAAGEWLSARAEQRAGLRDEEEPEWLVRAGKELELMLKQWQQRQEDRLETGTKPRWDGAATPPSKGRQGRQASEEATSPVGFTGLEQATAHRRRSGVVQVAGKQGGGRQRKEKIARNAAAREAAAGRGRGPQAACVQSHDAQAVQAEQDRMERQLRAEVEEARQLAAAMRASRDQARGAAEGDDDIIDAQFRELCDAAGVAPEDVYAQHSGMLPRASGTMEEAVFRRKCRRAGVTAACGGQREQLRRLHVARARGELFMRNKLGNDWRRTVERNLQVARARYAARQWLATEAQGEAGRGAGGVGGGGGV